jgi:hypothetical protein
MSVAGRNKATGRAFQAKLAEMSGGMNIGTLGGEDVMHEEFSYEAKTYRPNSKTHKGKDWTGEQFLSSLDKGKPDPMTFAYGVIHSTNTLVMLRWCHWERIFKERLIEEQMYHAFDKLASKFVGCTYMRQAEANCPDGKIPVVVVHTVGRRHYTDIVLILLDYWHSLLEKYIDKSL